MLSSPEFSPRLVRITALLNEGKLSQAETACKALLATSATNAAATHLLGLTRARSGDAAEGERLMRRSIELEQGNFRFHLNFASFLRRHGRLAEAESEYRKVLQMAPKEATARHSLALTLNDTGRYAEAETECRTLLSSNPNDPEAWSALGFILNNSGRLFEAEAAYRRSLAMNANYGLAHHNLGALLARMDRAEESLESLVRARSLGVHGFELSFSCGKALTLLYRLTEAEQAFAEAVSLRPRHIDGQLNLARLRYMRGDPDFARGISSALDAYPADVQLHGLLTTVLLRAGKFDSAGARLAAAIRQNGPLPQFRFLNSQVLRESGRLQEAETEALEAVATKPQDSALIENLVSILLSRGKPDDALPFIRMQRDREPLGQGWLAYEGIAARLLGQSLYRELFDYERLVRLYPLQPPRGWSSMAELNAALVEALEARHRFNSHPLDQSLRHGSQTTRNLVADPDPAIRALLQAFEEPIRMYLHELGRDAGHPLSARNRGSAAIAASWSVQLHRDGFHVNHFHNQGWISSAYYVAVPDEIDDRALKSGWLKFGEPRYPVPGAVPEHFVRPNGGLLALFPSYLWHGTNAIHGPQLRTTVAFDAVPARD
jgi:Flp pilus assembly protein TadD